MLFGILKPRSSILSLSIDFAQKRGFEESTGEYIGTMDVNSKDQILYFKKLIERLNEGYDIAVLSRYVLGGGDQRIFIRYR